MRPQLTEDRKRLLNMATRIEEETSGISLRYAGKHFEIPNREMPIPCSDYKDKFQLAAAKEVRSMNQSSGTSDFNALNATSASSQLGKKPK